MPIWLNFLLTMPSYCLVLSLGSCILGVKIRSYQMLFIATLVGIINIGLERGFNTPIIKVVIPIVVMIFIYSVLTKTKIRKSSLAVILGFNVFAFIESITLIFIFNGLKILPEAYLSDAVLNTLVIVFLISVGLGIILVLNKTGWRLYDLDQMDDNVPGNKWRLNKKLLLMGACFAIYCIVLLTTASGSLNTSNSGFIIYTLNFFSGAFFLGTCVYTRYIERKEQKLLAAKTASEVSASLTYHVDAEAEVLVDLARKMDHMSNLIQQRRPEEAIQTLSEMKSHLIPQPSIESVENAQLRMFLQSRHSLALARKIDFWFEPGDLTGLDDYINSEFIDMLAVLYKNAFEAVGGIDDDSGSREIYSTITRDNDGGFTGFIKDSACTLPSGNQTQLLEDGYTTKRGLNRGHGLHKAKVYLDYHKGRIDIRGLEGFTVVTFWLPPKDDLSIQPLNLEDRDEHNEPDPPTPPGNPGRPVLRLIKNDR